MNQGGALIQVYRDGSVLLSHGGTEMGQGLFTKTIQVNRSIANRRSVFERHLMEPSYVYHNKS